MEHTLSPDHRTCRICGAEQGHLRGDYTLMRCLSGEQHGVWNRRLPMSQVGKKRNPELAMLERDVEEIKSLANRRTDIIAPEERALLVSLAKRLHSMKSGKTHPLTRIR